MKILLMGYTHSVYIRDYIRFVLNDSCIEVTLVDNGSAAPDFYDFYRQSGVRLVHVPFSTPILGRIPKIRVLWYEYRLRRALKKNGPYDVIHLHFVSPEKFRYIRGLIKPGTQLVASFWGSDIYRQATKSLWKLQKHLDSCSSITLSGERMLHTFQKIFGSRYNRVVRQVYFGVTIFKAIDEAIKTLGKYQSKVQLGINPESIVVAIGYNRMEAQQHDKVLEVLGGIPEEVLKKITLVLPFTYGECTDDYETKVLTLLHDLPSANLVVRGFQTADRVAVIRLATDIYINAQTTDAFSASVQEYLYAGALLLNPVWLEYYELKGWGIYYQEYQNFCDLPVLLEKVVREGLPDLHENAKVLESKTSWSAVRQSWLDIYQQKNTL